MELTEIRYFLAVCETLNFSRAADRCHITQPALSRAVQKLELELGSQLFCRDKAQVQLTEFGRMMRPTCTTSSAAGITRAPWRAVSSSSRLRP